MKVILSAAVCITVLYFLDAQLFNGIYFGALKAMVTSLMHHYRF